LSQGEKLSSSLEDYLETIYAIVRKKGAARPTDIARERNVAASSVTTALKNLKKLGLVNHEPYDLVTLTPSGSKLAMKVTEKHNVLLDFFTGVLEIDPETAEKCACSMEHAIPQDVLERFTAYLEFVRKCDDSGRRYTDEDGFVCRCVKNRDGS
jgi:DtxR family Mn-dependent transcriptional regulator